MGAGAVDGTIREATAADALAIAELWLRSRRGAPGVPPASHADDAVRAWFQDVVVPAGGVWVVSQGGVLDAMMVIKGDWVEQLYVAPESQRQGHGSRLLRLAQSSRTTLTLWTFEANTPARAFYETHGFEVDGPVSTDNEERAPAVRYRWSKSSS
jgi:GNAT superfamily N-acetyltransferase